MLPHFFKFPLYNITFPIRLEGDSGSREWYCDSFKNKRGYTIEVEVFQNMLIILLNLIMLIMA